MTRAWARLLPVAALTALVSCGDGSGGTSTTPDSGENNVRVERDASVEQPDAGGSGDATSDASSDMSEVDLGPRECDDDPDCSDGVFCNGIERCFEGKCFASPVPQCSDPSDCTEDNCDEANRRCDFVPNDALCAPGQVCTSKAGCFMPAQCATDADCDDALMCNGVETCVAGECQPGTPPDCDDGIACTSDTCIEGEGACQNVADHGRCLGTELCSLAAGCVVRPPCQSGDDCDDGLFCNGRETCEDGVCTPGAPPTAPDGVDCTIDQCSEALDMVRHTPDNARCSDGQFCNGAEVCHPANGCGPGAPPVLSDGVGCTDDSCDEALDFIVHTPNDAACDDGAFCNGEEVCHPVDDCQPGEPPVVNDGVGCTADSCSEVMDQVLHIPDDGACDDNLFCNGQETCDPVADCQAGTPPPLDDGFDCTVDSCDESADQVVHTPNDALCDDGMFCTGVETCVVGMGCMATPPTLDDGVDCTMDSCDETNDQVVHAPDDGFCDDGLLCTGTETCDPVAGCQSTGGLMVDDGIDCTVDSCDEMTGVTHTPDDSLCDNGQFCDGEETCDAQQGCQDGPNPPVSDNDPCTFDFCQESDDSIRHTNAPNGTLCNSSPRSICLSGQCGQSRCSDGFVDSGAGEECDDGGTMNGDGCDSNCKIEVPSSCDPDGAWSLTTTLAHTCGFGLANAQATQFTFSLDATTATGLFTGFISPTDPTTMGGGSAATCPGGSFSISATLPGGPGGCTEIYTLSGTFTDADTWSGTFNAEYIDVSSSGACLDCDSMTWNYNLTGFR